MSHSIENAGGGGCHTEGIDETCNGRKCGNSTWRKGDINRESIGVSLFRRPLPSPPAYAFSSTRGKELFTSSMKHGFCDAYFPLAENFRTQDEPAFCGLSTLVMALNALRVDPGRPWKGPWRFFHEEMLDCCQPLDVVREKGITMSDFACLARCNFAHADVVYAEDSDMETLRDAIRRATSGSMEEVGVLVASYDRRELQQTGTGHFSPIAAYDPESDMALVMDVARFKYPPQWIPVPILFQAMSSLDQETERSRGYIFVKSRQAQALLFTLKRSSHMHWPAVGKWWSQVQESVAHATSDSDALPPPPLPTVAAAATTLASCPGSTECDTCCLAEETARQILSSFPRALLDNVITTYSKEYGVGALTDVRDSLDALRDAIETTTAFRQVEIFAREGGVELENRGDMTVDVRHLYALLLLASLKEEAIFRNCQEEDRCELQPILQDVEQAPPLLREEVENVRKTLDAVALQTASAIGD